MRMRARGFTLIELLVTIAVLAILLAVAVPSFTSFRQRTALEGAGEQLTSAWNEARFEALRRDQLLKVSLVTASGDFCIGVDETTNPADSTACDCFETVATESDFCGVSVYPGATSDWGGIALQAPDGSADYRLNFYVDTRGRAVLCEPSAAPDKMPHFTDRRCSP